MFEDRGHFQDHREVHGFETGALVYRAVAAERYRDVVAPADLRGQRRADRNRRPPGNDAVGAENALLDVGDVHAAALALAQALRRPPQLLHHVDDVSALGDAMAVAAMRADDRVSVAEVLADADCVGLLARVQVREARNLSVHDLGERAVLEDADRAHLAVGAE